jgi:hypothetical protein
MGMMMMMVLVLLLLVNFSTFVALLNWSSGDTRGWWLWDTASM